MAGNQQKPCDLRKKLEECIKASGYDETFISACKFHLGNVLLKSDRSKITTREEQMSLLMSNFFIDKMDNFPAKRFKCQINDDTGWPLKLLPSEVFAENTIPVETRKIAFYHCLQIGEYLECRVILSFPDKYHLKAVHKYGVARILADLNILVIMQKTDKLLVPEMLKEFIPGELVRVVVTGKEKEENEIKICASVIDNKTDIGFFKPPLGRIPVTDLPEYVVNTHHSNRPLFYKDYLVSKGGFHNPVLLNGIYESFGIDPRGTYSYFPTNKSWSSIDANALLKETKRKDALDYMKIASRDLAAEKHTFAFTAIKLAKNCYPEAVDKKGKEELSKLFRIKGDIHASEKKPKLSLKGCKKWLKAKKIDQANEEANTALSKAIFIVAMKYYKKKMYNKAAEWASRALNLDKDNEEAHNLMEHLKRSYPEATVDWDEECYPALFVKQRVIGSELQKLDLVT